MPAAARPHAVEGALDPVLQSAIVPVARGFSGTTAVFVKDLSTGAGAAWNARARFPAARDKRDRSML